MGVMFHLARDEDISMLWMSPMASVKPWAAIEKVFTFTAIETVVAIFAKKFVLPSAPVEASWPSSASDGCPEAEESQVSLRDAADHLAGHGGIRPRPTRTLVVTGPTVQHVVPSVTV